MSNKLDWKTTILNNKDLCPKTTLVPLTSPHDNQRSSIQDIVNFTVKLLL
jgi:hypothetical protein